MSDSPKKSNSPAIKIVDYDDIPPEPYTFIFQDDSTKTVIFESKGKTYSCSFEFFGRKLVSPIRKKES